LLIAAAPAHANGAFPDELSVQFPLDAPHRILLGTNFGMLISEDDGATWRYTCEPYVTTGSLSAAALSGANVLMYQATADGALLEASVDVRRSARGTDLGCGWPVSTFTPANPIVTDIFAAQSDPNLVLAITGTTSGTFLVASHDGGRTFGPTPLNTDRFSVLSGVEVARSNASVVYATVLHSGNGTDDPGKATLRRSDDGGTTWPDSSSFVIPSPTPPATPQPLILAVDPQDSSIVYLRLLSGTQDSIAIATNGGQSVQTVLTISGQFTSFLRATDGTLYAGTLEGNLYVRPATPPNASFTTRTNAPHFRCLGQRFGTSDIYACGDMTVDGFSLGVSHNGGQSFQKVMSFTELKGPLTCAAVQTACAPHWERRRLLDLAYVDGAKPGERLARRRPRRPPRSACAPSRAGDSSAAIARASPRVTARCGCGSLARCSSPSPSSSASAICSASASWLSRPSGNSPARYGAPSPARPRRPVFARTRASSPARRRPARAASRSW
jgi:hypothetical protein